MDYRYLEAFLSLVEAKNFSKAAAQMQIAQSALSRQIKLFEEKLGKQLFVRSSHQVLLTPEGEELAKEAIEFNRWVDEKYQQSKTLIRVGALEGVMLSWIEPKLVKLSIENIPNLDLRVGTAEFLIERMKQGQLDLIFTNENIDNEMMSSKKVYQEKFILISKKPVDPKKVHEERWIYGDNGHYLMSLARKKRSSHSLRIEGHEILMRFVEAGLGVAVIPKNMLPKNFRGSVQDLPQLKSGFIYMTTLNYKRMPQKLANIIQVLS